MPRYPDDTLGCSSESVVGAAPKSLMTELDHGRRGCLRQNNKHGQDPMWAGLWLPRGAITHAGRDGGGRAPRVAEWAPRASGRPVSDRAVSRGGSRARLDLVSYRERHAADPHLPRVTAGMGRAHDLRCRTVGRYLAGAAANSTRRGAPHPVHRTCTAPASHRTVGPQWPPKQTHLNVTRQPIASRSHRARPPAERFRSPRSASGGPGSLEPGVTAS